MINRGFFVVPPVPRPNYKVLIYKLYQKVIVPTGTKLIIPFGYYKYILGTNFWVLNGKK